MKFKANQKDIQKSLNYCQGVIEKRSTLPILSNVLINVEKTELTLTATDLDLIFIHKIKDIEDPIIDYSIFNSLAYGQWTLKEIESGEAWENITKNKY